jgi:hypothetical protein
MKNDRSICITINGGDITLLIPQRDASAEPIAAGQAAPAGFEIRDDVVIDLARGLMWSRADVVPKGCNHATAEKACRELRLHGFDDWRLPTRAELLTLVDDTRHEPAIDTAAFPSCKSNWYWTSTPCAWSSGCAWFVSFGYGYASLAPRGNGYAHARAVRSVSPGQ